MIPTRLVIPVFATLALASCASNKADRYDTMPPSGGGQANAGINPNANPTYDTPAAYGDNSASAVNPPANAPIAPYNPEPAYTPPTAAAPAPQAPANGAATIHTVVAGDTLSGISAKYKVPTAAIKQANGMTKDTVILGRKMVIPPAR